MGESDLAPLAEFMLQLANEMTESPAELFRHLRFACKSSKISKGRDGLWVDG